MVPRIAQARRGFGRGVPLTQGLGQQLPFGRIGIAALAAYYLQHELDAKPQV